MQRLEDLCVHFKFAQVHLVHELVSFVDMHVALECAEHFGISLSQQEQDGAFPGASQRTFVRQLSGGEPSSSVDQPASHADIFRWGNDCKS